MSVNIKSDLWNPQAIEMMRVTRKCITVIFFMTCRHAELARYEDGTLMKVQVLQDRFYGNNPGRQ